LAKKGSLDRCGGARSVLHEGGVLLAGSRVYSTKVRGSCSTDNPWPVHPAPRAVAALKGPGQKPPAVQRPLKPSGRRREPGEGHPGPSECPGGQKRDRVSRSATKARIALIHTEQNRMIPRFSLMRSGGLEVLCCRSGHQQADPPKKPGAADLRGTVINVPPLLARRSRPEAHLGARPGLFITLDQQIEDSDLPAPRWTGRAQSASPRTHRAQTCQRPGGQERHCPLRRRLTGLRPADVPEIGAGTVCVAAGSQGSDLPVPRSGIERRSRLAPRGSPPCPCLRSHDTQTSQK